MLILIPVILIVAFGGIGLIFLSQRLTKETRMVRGKIKKAVRNRNKPEESISGGDKINDLEEKETYCCNGCGREISETEYCQSGGLCDRCRGMPLQQGFPTPPGFPKF